MIILEQGELSKQYPGIDLKILILKILNQKVVNREAVSQQELESVYKTLIEQDFGFQAAQKGNFQTYTFMIDENDKQKQNNE